MAAPIMDKLLPPIVFLVGLMVVFISLVAAMTPTIESNQNSQFNAPHGLGPVDYFMMFPNGTYAQSGIWAPDPFIANYSKTMVRTPPCSNSYATQRFWNNATSSEHHHSIYLFLIRKHAVDLSGDRHELYFQQQGGWLGAQDYDDALHVNDWTKTYANSSDPSWYATINLRHAYSVVLRPGPGSNNTFTSFQTWNFNLTIMQLINATHATDPWTIVAQLFTFSLPGVPLFILGLIMVPIYATIAVVAYALVRSVFPF